MFFVCLQEGVLVLSKSHLHDQSVSKKAWLRNDCTVQNLNCINPAFEECILCRAVNSASFFFPRLPASVPRVQVSLRSAAHIYTNDK